MGFCCLLRKGAWFFVTHAIASAAGQKKLAIVYPFSPFLHNFYYSFWFFLYVLPDLFSKVRHASCSFSPGILCLRCCRKKFVYPTLLLSCGDSQKIEIAKKIAYLSATEELLVIFFLFFLFFPALLRWQRGFRVWRFLHFTWWAGFGIVTNCHIVTLSHCHIACYFSFRKNPFMLQQNLVGSGSLNNFRADILSVEYCDSYGVWCRIWGAWLWRWLWWFLWWSARIQRWF